MFQQQPAARGEAAGGLGNDLADVIQTIGTTRQCAQGLVRQGGQVRVSFRHVRGVGHDQLKWTRYGIHPVAQHVLHRQVQALGVGAGYDQGVGAGVHRRHLRNRTLVLQGQRHGPTARPQVQHASCFIRKQQFQRPFDQDFRVGARVQHPGVHLQHEAKKVFVPGDVGHRLALQAAMQGLAPAVLLHLVQHLGIVGQ